MVAALALGGLLAWLLWPSPAPIGQAPAEGPAPAETAAPAVAAGQGGAPADLAGIARVRLRVSDTLPDARRQEIVNGLKQAGVQAEIVVTPLMMAIGTTRIGYFRPEDKDKATALAQVAAAVLGSGTALPVRDYAKLDSAPETGVIDLWVGG